MGKFEDEIKKKLTSGEMDYNPSHWDQLSNILAATPSLSAFEQKIQDTLSEGEASSAPNWEEFSNNLNSLDPFEKELKQKLDSGESPIPNNSWDQFSEKLADSKLTQFEKGVKTTLNSGEISYNHAHWKAFEKMLNGSAGKKWFMRSAAALLILLGISYGIDQSIPEQEDIISKQDKSTTNPLIEVEDNSSSILNSSKIELGSNSSNGTIGKTTIKPNGLNGVSNNNNNNNNNSSSSSNYGNNRSSGKLPNKTDGHSLSPNNVNANNTGISDLNNDIITPDKKTVIDDNKTLNSIFKINKKTELCSSLDFIKAITTQKPKKKLEYQVQPGAALWLNIWQNPAVTGLYGKNNISGYYLNNWEFIDENQDKSGEIKLIQPLVYLGAYERRLNKGFAVGGSYKYELKRNWNNREFTAYFSYAKTIAKGLDFRLGGASSYRNYNLSVNRLTLRERIQNSNDLEETKLGEFKSKQQYSITNHLGAFINHENFFLSYTLFNAVSQSITNENEVIPVKHCIMSGVHTPQFLKMNASALLKYEKELFESYTPGLSLTYDNKIFVTAEYESLIRPKLSLGYNFKRKLRAHASYAIKNLTDIQKELNLDNFVDRQGYINLGLNYNF